MADGIDATCTDCEYMHRDRDGGRWCSSPQLLRSYGYSMRCIWERDHVKDPLRQTPADQKCGPNAINWKRRGSV